MADRALNINLSYISRQRLITELVIITIIAIIGVIWVFSPIWSQFSSVPAAGYRNEPPLDDPWQNVWMLWWTARAVMSGQSPFQTDMLFYPLKVDLFWQTLQVTNGVLFLPITLSFGPIASYNVIAVTTFISSVILMYLLARALGYTATAAGIVAVIFGFSPFHLTKLYDGQLEVMNIQFFPLLTMGLLHVIYGKRWKIFSSVLVSCLIAWIMLTSLYYGLFALLYTAAVFGWSLLLDRAPLRRYPIRIGYMLLCLSVPVGLILANRTQLPYLSPDAARLRVQGRSAQIIDFFLPSPHHPLWGEAIAHIQTSLHPYVKMVNISLGIVLWLLVVFSLLRLRQFPTRWFHIALALTFMVLAMGPQLIWNGQPTGIPLPFSLIAEWPGVQAGQRPNHFIILAAVHLCLLAAGAIDDLLSRYARYRSVLAFGLISLVVFDLAPQPVPGSIMPLSPAYQAIPPGHGAVFELPFQIDDVGPMVAQIKHQRPILGGYLARTPFYPFEDVEGIQLLWFGQETATILSQHWHRQLIEVMQSQNIEYVIVHEQLLSESQRRIAAQLADVLDVVYRDEQTTLYRLPVPLQPNLTISLGEGWHDLEHNDLGLHWQWTEERADINVFNPFATPQMALLQLEMAVFQPPVTLVVQGSATAPLAIPVTVKPRIYSVVVTVPAGHSVLTLAADPALPLPAEKRVVGVAVRSLQLIRCHSGGCTR